MLRRVIGREELEEGKKLVKKVDLPALILRTTLQVIANQGG